MEIANEFLQKNFDNGKVTESYLLIDKDILKLKKIAEWFLKGGNNHTNPYNVADIFWLVPKEGTTSIQVEATEAFIEKASYASIGGKKLYIICDASTMTISAQNKILKTIEEASANTTFLLLASNAEPILNTIKSRCVTVYPAPLENSLTEEALIKENKNSETIFKNVSQLLTSLKTLDEALPLLPILTAKENFAVTMLAFDRLIKEMLDKITLGETRLSIQKLYGILKKLAIINRNVAANCNVQNCFDSLLMEILNA